MVRSPEHHASSPAAHLEKDGWVCDALTIPVVSQLQLWVVTGNPVLFPLPPVQAARGSSVC